MIFRKKHISTITGSVKLIKNNFYLTLGTRAVSQFWSVLFYLSMILLGISQCLPLFHTVIQVGSLLILLGISQYLSLFHTVIQVGSLLILLCISQYLSLFHTVIQVGSLLILLCISQCLPLFTTYITSLKA